MGDFDCGEINWELREVGDGNTSTGRPMKLVMENMMIQWSNENTRNRGEVDSSRHNLVLTIGVNLKREANYMSPFGKNDHVTMRMGAMGEVQRD